MAAGDVQIGPAMRAPSSVDAIVPSVILAVLIAGSLVAKAWERAQEAAAGAKKEADDYIRQAAGRSPAQEIADAKALLEAGTITQAEFESLKAKSLS